MTTLLGMNFSKGSSAPATTTPEMVMEVLGPARVVNNSCLNFMPITPTDADVRTMTRGVVNLIATHDRIGIQRRGWKFGDINR